MKIKCSGVASRVFGGDREQVGHVLMADYDDVEFSDVYDDALAIDGPVVLVESSRQSWHLWGLGLREWDEVVDDLGRLGASASYVDEMIERGRCVLRTSAKLRADGEAVTPAPIPRVVLGGVGPVSRPHTVMLRQLAEQAGRDDVAESLDRMGIAASGETYTREMWAYDDGREAAEGRKW